MQYLVPHGTCHSRWCPTYLPAFMDNFTQLPVHALCQNVTDTLENRLTSSFDQLVISNNRRWIGASCQLWCGEAGRQLLQLQSAELSRPMAMWMWFVVALMLTCAVFQLLSTCAEWGAGKVAMVGGPLFLAFMALIATYFTDEYDTPFYPIVGAMNVTALSYFFSSFQYSIGLTYELASASALVVSMLPLWSLLTSGLSNILGLELDVIDRNLIRELLLLVLAMLLASLLWIIHSGIHRTVTFRANWIAAFNRQVREETPGGLDHMSGLWTLAGAQGHPTWRTRAGQSFGLYLTTLSWVIAAKIRIFYSQENYCTEDLLLFHILLWAPPMILTLAVLVTQGSMCSFKILLRSIANNSVEGGRFPSRRTRGFQAEIEALISYRLGRDTLEVEQDSDKVRKDYGWKMDKWLALTVWYCEFVFMDVVAFPGIIVCTILQWLGTNLLRSTCGEWCEGSGAFELKASIKAYQVLCEHCTEATEPNSVEESMYKRSMRESHGLQQYQINDAIRTILRNHRKHIKLSLVLDNIGPSSLVYLLPKLAEVLSELTVPNGAMADGNLEMANGNGAMANTNGNREEAPTVAPTASGRNATEEVENPIREEVENPRKEEVENPREEEVENPREEEVENPRGDEVENPREEAENSTTTTLDEIVVDVSSSITDMPLNGRADAGLRLRIPSARW